MTTSVLGRSPLGIWLREIIFIKYILTFNLRMHDKIKNNSRDNVFILLHRNNILRIIVFCSSKKIYSRIVKIKNKYQL
jgi:hypothetical protein